jgi:hypothetical protein
MLVWISARDTFFGSRFDGTTGIRISFAAITSMRLSILEVSPYQKQSDIRILRLASGMPLLTQSDPGTENYNVAKAQTTLRQQLDPSLEGTIQHRWKHSINASPEIFWSNLCQTWSPGFEDLFDHGINSGIYDVSNSVQWYVL